MSASIADCLSDADAFGPWFAGPSWSAWKAVMRAAFALPLSDSDREVFADLAGGRAPPARRVRELWIIAGRRAGKDSIASALAAWFAAIEQIHVGKLRPGEVASILCIATDRDQARIIKNYAEAYFNEIPELGAMVESRTKNGFLLNNGAEIVIATNSWRQVRGRTISLAVFDECAFWRDEESANPDIELYRAVRPSQATLPGSMLIGISSPHSKSGLLYGKWREFFGKDDDNVLVIQAASLQLNPALDPREVEQAFADDPAIAKAEYGGEFRDDVGAFVPLELIERCVDPGVTVRPPRPGVYYNGFADAASGVGKDSFAVGITHQDGGQILLDLAHEIRPPFSPEAAISEVSALLKSYNISTVTGDKYAPGFVSEGFSRNGISYKYAEDDRSQIYVNTLPLLTSGRARLLDNRKLVAQFASLERRTSAGGKDAVDHGRNAHDDLCNAAAGALVLAATDQGVNVSPEFLAASRAGFSARRFRQAYEQHWRGF
jgi:hypothetical protein